MLLFARLHLARGKVEPRAAVVAGGAVVAQNEVAVLRPVATKYGSILAMIFDEHSHLV